MGMNVAVVEAAAAHAIRVNSPVFVRHPCGGCACVLYIVSHRNSLLSIFLFIFATFQLTLNTLRAAFSAENVVEHCSCSNLFPFLFSVCALIFTQIEEEKNLERKFKETGHFPFEVEN